MSDEYVAIRQLVERYADAVCRVDPKDWGACWAPDGVWELGANNVEGRDNIVELWTKLMSGFPMAIQVIHSGVVLSVEGDTARGRWYLSEFLHTPDGGRRLGIGVYHDTYSRVDGKWAFARRKYNLLYSGAPDLSGDPIPFPRDL